MGCRLSKDHSGSTSVSNGTAAGTIQGGPNMVSYQEACRTDPDIQSFDHEIQLRMFHTISSIANDPQLGIRALSFESIRSVTGCLLDTNQDVVKVILQSKMDIWNDKGLFDLVQEYFENSKQTMNFCSVLESCLKKVRDRVVIARSALQYFQEEEEEEEADSDGKRKHRKTLDMIRCFKEAGDPFNEEFFQSFEAVRNQQLAMLKKLLLQREKLQKRMRSVKSWRKVCSVIFVSSVATILICSVVGAALAAPPVAAALAAAASVPLGSLGKWIDSLWKACEEKLKDQHKFVTTMQLQTIFVKSDLDNIKVLVDNLRIHLDSLLSNADFALRGDEAVRFGIEEIQRKLDAFMNSVDDLDKQADRCNRDAHRARTVVLEKIMCHSNGN